LIFVLKRERDDMAETASTRETHFDIIVVGSGMGGLTCASLLTQFYDKKVLILESHSKIGGYTHSFSRSVRDRRVSWDVGLHYVGQMGEKSSLRKVMNRVTGGKVQWKKLSDPHQWFIYPGLKIAVPSSSDQFKSKLMELFPSEVDKIGTYFMDIRRATNWANFFHMARRLPRSLQLVLRFLLFWGYRLAFQKTSEYFGRRNFSKELSAVLDSQWGDYGLPSGQSPFFVNALVFTHYLNGAYCPVGSSQAIPQAVASVVKGGGGDVRVRHEVKDLLLDGDRVIGVKAMNLFTNELIEARAPIVISNIGLINTYQKLIPELYARSTLDRISKLPEPCSGVCLFLTLKEPPSKLGIQDQILWLFDSYDHDRTWESRRNILNESPSMVFLSFSANSDLEGKVPTAQILTFADSSSFREWGSLPLKGRGAEYEGMKNQISLRLIEFVERSLPGFKALVDFYELATPLTFESYSKHPQGAIYGIPLSVNRFENPWISVKTPLKGLYLTGADIAGPGIAGAMMGGVLTLSEIVGLSVFGKVFRM
jgi:phytoene dehydrogenase-like protein